MNLDEKKIKNFSSRQIIHKGEEKELQYDLFHRDSLKSVWKQISTEIPGWLLTATTEEISKNFKDDC